MRTVSWFLPRGANQRLRLYSRLQAFATEQPTAHKAVWTRFCRFWRRCSDSKSSGPAPVDWRQKTGGDPALLSYAPYTRGDARGDKVPDRTVASPVQKYSA